MYLVKAAIFSYTFSAIGLFLLFVCLSNGPNKDLVRRLFFVLATCTVLSFASPNSIINILASSLIIPVFAKRLNHVAPIFIFYFLNMPAISLPLNVGSIYLFEWYNYSSLAMGALIYCSINTKKISAKNTISLCSVLILIFLYFTIGVRGTSASNAVRVIVDLLCSIMLPYILITKSIKSIEDIKSFFIGLASATASLSGLAIYEARVGWPIYTSLSSHYGSVLGGGSSIKLRGGFLRSAGPFPEPTSFALWLSLGTFVVITSRWMFKSKYHQIFSSILCFYGLISPQSRGAILGLICGFIFFKIMSTNFAKAIQGIAVCLIGVIMLYCAGLAVPSVGSMIGLNSTGTLNRDYRQDLFSRGMEEAYKHPVLGQSIPDVMDSLADLKQGEGIIDFVNTYLYILLTTGFVGMALFVISISSSVFQLLKVNKRFRRQKVSSAAAAASIIFSISVMLVFTSLVGRTTAGLSIFIAIGGCLSSMRGIGVHRNVSFKNIRRLNLIEKSKQDHDRRAQEKRRRAELSVGSNK